MTCACEKDIFGWLCGKVPVDIVLNNILPYTYRPQPASLLMDIRSFRSDYHLVDSYYSEDYNHYVLLYDLLYYVDRFFTIPSLCVHIGTIFKRHLFYKKIPADRVKDIIENSYYNDPLVHTERKVRFLWGLMTRHQRADFINRFLLVDDPV